MIFEKEDSRNQQCKGVEKFWTEKKLPVMVVEELAELQQAICKHDRWIRSVEDYPEEEFNKIWDMMIAEMADVYISLEAFQWMLSADHEDKLLLDKEIREAIDKKLSKKY